MTVILCNIGGVKLAVLHYVALSVTLAVTLAVQH